MKRLLPTSARRVPTAGRRRHRIIKYSPCVLLSLVLAASPLVDASRQHADLDYEACVATLAAAKSLPTKERARAELVLGLCHFALGHEAAARSAIESSYRRDPAALPPASASPKELAFIESVRATTPSEVSRPTARRTTKKDLEPPKPADAPIEPTPTPPTASSEQKLVAQPVGEAPPAPPLVVLVPEAPPAPKATWLPWLTGGLAVASAGAGVGLGLNARGLEASARAEPVQIEAAKAASNAQLNATAANVAFAVAGTAVIATVISFIATR